MFGHFLYSKQAILEQKRKIVNGQKIENFKRGQPMVFLKNWKFENCFVLIKRSLEEVSGDNLYSKNAVQTTKLSI